MRGLLILLLLAASWPLVQERQVRLDPPTPGLSAQLARVELARELARAAPSGALSATFDEHARALGLSLQRDGDVVALLEPKEPWLGQGVLLLRLGPLPQELVLQAPHPTSDLKTGELTSQLFDTGRVRAAMFATTHRDSGEDAAHDVESPLQQLTQGLAEGLPNPLFVQIHGFSASTSSADVVVAVGRGLSDADCFARQVGAALLVTDVRTGAQEPLLAATKNAQSLLLRGVARFLHIELSKDLRDSLVAEPTRRDLLLGTLLDLAGDAQCGGER